MKSIKQQYIDLTEGKMNQAQFMRNVRMTLPHLVTNVTSFDDTVKILRNKGILTEIKDFSRWATDKVTPEEKNAMDKVIAKTREKELAKGTKIEKGEHHVSSKQAQKIASDHVKEDPKYYDKLKKAGLEESNYGMSLEDAKAEAERISYEEGVVQHVNQITTGNKTFYEVSDWFDDDSTVASYEDGELIGEYTLYDDENMDDYFFDINAEEDLEESDIYGIAGDPEKEKMAKSVKVSSKDDDDIKDILKHLDAEDEKKKSLKENKYINTSGKDLYSQFKEIDNLNGQEVLIGIDYEIEKNHNLNKVAAAKIVVKNLKKNPFYYTDSLMYGKEGAKVEYMAKFKPGSDQMKDIKGNELVDKANGMTSPKNIEKVKASANKANKETNKMVSGVKELTFNAKTVRGLKKFNPTGEKMKTIRESVDKALAKERLKEMIRQEMKELFDGRANMSYGMLGTQYDETGENK